MDDPRLTTLASYDERTAAYLAADGPDPSAAARLLAGALAAGTRVLEIGSGSGRDAAWLREQGLDVQVSDASEGFRRHLHTRALVPLAYDVTTDPVPEGAWAGVLANAVLLHVPREALAPVLVRLREGVRPGCAFALSLKTGSADGWSTEKLGAPRWFTYWEEPDIRSALTSAGWRVDRCDHSTGRSADWLTILAAAI